MNKKEKTGTYQDRIQLLEEFRKAIMKWFNKNHGPQGRDELKSYINRNLMAVRSVVQDAGTLRLMAWAPPSAIGGLAARGIDPFHMIFQDLYGLSVIPDIADMVDQAIGVYQHLDANTGLIRLQSPQGLDIEAAIERALRPAFHDSAPSSERQVQDQVETILSALGIEYFREKEAAPVGPRAFHPDFTVSSLELAIEIKLARESHGASKIQEELLSDISAYGTKWKRLLVIIYDNGVIIDPYRMRRENMKHFGVSVVIVKH